MKFIKSTPTNGETRIIKKFAIFPISVRSFKRKETRWLENVYLKQIYRIRYYEENYWENVEFVSAKYYENFIQQMNAPF